MPVDLYHNLSFRLSFYLSDLALPPQAGLFLGGFLHLLSILAHVISPDSDVSLGSFLVALSRRDSWLWGSSSSSSSTARKVGKGIFKSDRKSAFAPSTGSGAGGLAAAGPSPAEQIRRLASARRESWLRGMVSGRPGP